MKKAYFFLCFFSITLLAAQTPTCELIPKERVLLVGDSWSQFTYLYNSYNRAFTRYGYPDIGVIGDRTAIGGTRASGWATSTNLELVRIELEEHPDVELIILCVGGNDMVAASGWRRSMNQAQRDSVFDQVRAHIETIIDFIIQQKPDIEILLGGYDYMNFVETILDYPAGSTNPYESMWNTLENPGPSEVNAGLGELESRKIAISRAYPNVQYVNSLGLNHHIYGYPDSLPVPPFGTFAAGTTPLPGQAPDYLPLNGGNINYPSPQVAMGPIVPGLNILPGFDCIHLNEESYYHYAHHQTEHALLDFLKGNPDVSVNSEGDLQDGWVNDAASVSTESIQIGIDSASERTYGFISFHTEGIDANEQIGSASIFLKRISLQGAHPFSEGVRLDMKMGTWGQSPDLEAADISETADLEDAACLVTLATADGFVLRMDLKNEALPYLNPAGYTQFRFVISDTANAGLLSFFDGDSTAKMVPPRLDVFYGTPASSPPPTAELAPFVYPNPVADELNIRFSGSPQGKVSFLVKDLMGKTIYFGEKRHVQQGEKISINLPACSSGLYLIEIQTETANWVQKIVKK